MTFQISDLNQKPSRNSLFQPILAVSKWFNGLRLQHKIGCSFGLAVSVAFVGITTGVGVAESSLRQARVDIEASETQREMLAELKVNLLRMHLHQKGSILTLNDLSQWTEVYALFLADRERFESVWLNYKKSQKLVASSTIGNSTVDNQKAQKMSELVSYHNVFTRDLDSLVARLESVDLEALSGAERLKLQAELTQFNNKVLRQDAYRFLDQVKVLNDLSKRQLESAKISLDKAEVFRLRVIIASVITSLILASVLTYLLSRTISSSVQKAAETATQVIETSNFDLQIPVTSTDEIGQLSTALNRLIMQIKQLLRQEQEKSDSLAKALNEIQSTQAVLVQNEKMSALGQMVAGIAHEINNPISFIHGNLEPLQRYVYDFIDALKRYQQHDSLIPQSTLLALEGLDLDYLAHDSEKIIKSMNEGTHRIREIVLSLRNFSRLGEADIKRVDIHEGIDSTLTILAHRLKETDKHPGIEVVKNYAELPKIECYAGLLNQVFMNILSNAVDAVRESCEGCSDEQRHECLNQVCIHTEMADQDSIRICIQDNGPGVPAHIIDKLFNPFFTTKPVGKGTGLGLSISHKIVTEKHQGTLQCHSTMGQGTKFVVQLPIRQSKATS